ncbi:MAG: MraY family glycosyltransferase [Bacteroidota bacterium]|nr:MraY family glycosyltransferase [Bacteroidota bacterium]
MFPLYPVTACAIALILMPICIRIAYRFHLFDMPDFERKIHKGRIPYTGGLGIIAAFGVVVWIAFAFEGPELQSYQHGIPFTLAVYVAEAAIIVILLGLLDDVKDLTFQRKFLFQFLASFFVIIGAIRSDVFPKVFNVEEADILVNTAGTLISVLWLVGSVNAVNMIDGMDGLAAGTSLIGTAALGLLAFLWGNLALALVAFILAGALVGFLPFNFHPARIFMGDTGSMFLGFLLGVIGWLLIDSAPMKSTIVFVPVIVLGLPIFDTLLAFTRRMIRRQNPFAGDRFHVHHMMKQRFNLSTRQTVLLLYAVAVVYAAFGIAVAVLPSTVGWVLIGSLVVFQVLFLHTLGYTQIIFRVEQAPMLAKDITRKKNGTYPRRPDTPVEPKRAGSAGLD